MVLTPILLITDKAYASEGLTAQVYNVQGQNASPFIPQGAFPALTLNVPNIDFQWGSGSVLGGPSEDVIVRFTGSVRSDSTQNISFMATGDDGTRLYIDGELITDDWVDKGGGGSTSDPISFTAGVPKTIELMYYENGGGANVFLYWDQSGSMDIVPASAFTSQAAPVVNTIGAPRNLSVIDSATSTVLTWEAPNTGNTQPERYAIGLNTEGQSGWGIATGNVGDANALNTTITIDHSLFESLMPSGTVWSFHIRSDNDTLALYSENSNVVTLKIGMTAEEIAAEQAAAQAIIDAENARLAAIAAEEARILEEARLAEVARLAEIARLEAEAAALLAAQQEAARVAAEQEAARLAALAAEAARIAAEQEAARLAALAAEAARIAAEQEAARIEAERQAALAEQARLAELEAQRLAAEEAARLDAIAAEQERLAEIERQAAIKAEQDRIAAELAAQKAEEERLAAIEAARIESERLAAIAAENARLAEIERQAAIKAEADRIAAEIKAAEEKAEEEAKAEAERIAAEVDALKQQMLMAAEAKAKAEEEARLEAERVAAEKAAEEQRERDRLAEEARLKAEAEAKAKAEEDARIERERIAAEEAKAKAEAERLEQIAKEKAALEAKILVEQKAKEAEDARLKAEADAKAAEEARLQKIAEDAKAGKELSKEEVAAVVTSLIEDLKPGESVSAEDIKASGVSYSDLPSSTPVEVRTDENGNVLVITAEVAASVELVQDPGALLEAVFTDPGAAIAAFGSIGADMTTEEREEATDMVIATVVATGAALNAVGLAASGSAPTAPSSGSSSGANSGGSRRTEKW